MVKTVENKKSKKEPAQSEKKTFSFSNFLHIGESYTSLILGIIVVIIATALLLSFVHNKNAGNKNTPINEQAQKSAEISQEASELSSRAPNSIIDSSATITPVIVTPTPTIVPTAQPKPTVKPNPTAQPKPTVKPNPTATPKPIAKPNPTATPKPTSVPPVIAKATAYPKVIALAKIKQVHHTNMKIDAMAKPKQSKRHASETKANKNIWIVQKNESLWLIAQEKYTSGYNWVDIARANNLSNPSDIHVGDRLILPNVTPKTPTILVINEQKNSTTSMMQHTNTISVPVNTHISNTTATTISGNTYTVVRGDNLWNVAVRAYGNGYRWPDIAKANNLSNPRMIFSGNVLQIPRP